MRKLTSVIIVPNAVGILLTGGVVLSPNVSAQTLVEQGKEIAFDRRKGNCMACHMMGEADLPGNIGHR